MRVRVCFHDQCFDGACSAALFTRFYQASVNPQARFDYSGLAHRAGQLFEDSLFVGDENAIVDFKYSSSDRLTWWFDHHQSAFLSEADSEHFRRDQSGRKFFDAEFRSCTKFIAHIGQTKFGFESRGLEELIRWADIIDGAQYSDPKTAVEMRDPAMQLSLGIEGARTKDFVAGLIPKLATLPLSEVAALPEIRRSFDELHVRHLKAMEVIRARVELKQGVAYFDLSDQGTEGFNKFIPYYLFPAAVYTVAVSSSPERAKVGVGSNPWNPTPKTVNLASICERYGGGGHAKVAAISLPPGDSVRARETGSQIAAELREALKAQGARDAAPA